MEKKKNNKYLKYNLAIALTLSFVVIEIYLFPYFSGVCSKFFELLGAYLVIAILGIWTISLQERIVDKRIRLLLVSMGLLLIGWMIIRSIKYYLISNATIIHYLWYLYYLPMIFVVCLWFCVSLLVGKREIAKLPNIIYLPLLISFVLFLLVMTNDLHNLVFTFNNNGLFDDLNYGYGIGYKIIVAWLVILALMSLIVLLYKCRNKHNKIVFLPFIITAPLLVCVISYVLEIKLVLNFVADITKFYSLYYMIIVESCIVSGLIQSNVFYKELFSELSIPLFIYDDQFDLYVKSKQAKKNRSKDILQATNKQVLVNDEYILSSFRINGGYVFFENDVRDLIKENQKLENVNEELVDQYGLSKRNYQIEKEKERLIQSARLYTKLQNDNRFRLERMHYLIEEIEKGNDESLLELAILSVYFKRRNNLLFLNQEKVKAIDELKYSLKESLDILKRFNIKVNMAINCTEDISLIEVIKIYEHFEVVLESCFDKLTDLVLIINQKSTYELFLVLNFKDDTDLNLAEEYILTKESANEYVVCYRVENNV